jgi:hypothetical protein
MRGHIILHRVKSVVHSLQHEPQGVKSNPTPYDVHVLTIETEDGSTLQVVLAGSQDMEWTAL